MPALTQRLDHTAAPAPVPQLTVPPPALMSIQTVAPQSLMPLQFTHQPPPLLQLPPPPQLLSLDIAPPRAAVPIESSIFPESNGGAVSC